MRATVSKAEMRAALLLLLEAGQVYAFIGDEGLILWALPEFMPEEELEHSLTADEVRYLWATGEST